MPANSIYERIATILPASNFTRPCSYRLTVLGLMLLSLCCSTWSLAQSNVIFEDVTLVKTDGWTYKGVSVALTSQGDTLKMVRSDGAILEISIYDVRLILDIQDQDITRIVLPTFPESSNQSSSSSSARPTYDEFGVGGEPEVVHGGWVFQEADPPRMFDAMIVAGLGYESPEGDFYDGLDGGLLYFGELCIATGSRKYVRLGFRTMRAMDLSESFYDYDTDSYSDINITADIRQYTITGGTLSRPSGTNKVRMYGEAGLSVVNHIFKSEWASQKGHNSETRLMVLGKGGVLVPLKNRVGLDMGVTLGVKLFGGNENEGIGFLLDAHAGLMIQFGGGQAHSGPSE